MKNHKTALAAALLCASTGVFAQTSSVTLYGSIDQYLSYMRSSSGVSIKSLNDGAALRSRIGFKGTEDLGNGWSTKFQLEHGLSADSGSTADSTRFFDRQAWVSLVSPAYGEFRIGRQNTAIFYRGDYIDYGSRTLGSIVNNFGTPSRYDNDLAWLSPRWNGLMLEVHYALGESAGGMGKQDVYQLAADYLNGPYRVGYASITGKPPANATYNKNVVYHNLYANYDYGQGKVYAVFIRSNNSTSSATASNTSNNGTGILGTVGSLMTGTNADVNRFYNITQLSADYRITPTWRVGALFGRISDTSHTGHNASGGSVGTFYDLSKRTTLLALVETMSNDTNAGFRPSGSAGVSPNFNGDNINGKRINGLQMGIIHRF
jgi:predicted porin